MTGKTEALTGTDSQKFTDSTERMHKPVMPEHARCVRAKPSSWPGNKSAHSCSRGLVGQLQSCIPAVFRESSLRTTTHSESRTQALCAANGTQ